jgi:hypothetical protein
MLKVGSLLLSKSIETKTNSIKPIENKSIESKQKKIGQNVVKPIENNTTTPKQNKIDQKIIESFSFIKDSMTVLDENSRIYTFRYPCISRIQI